MTTTTNNSDNKRKYKSKSLVIPTIISSDSCCDSNGCDTSLPLSSSSFKSRFSFRRNNSRRRGKSLSRFGDDMCDEDTNVTDYGKNDKLDVDTLPLCRSTRHKSASLVDLKNACNNLYRHLTTANGKICCIYITYIHYI